MDTSYAMAKFGLESKDILKSKQKGCWHYMKYFFFFSSIIQFLIILGLVLFMLYGNAHGTTETRLKSVESRYKNLTVDHALLKTNFSLLRERLIITEKKLKNCTDLSYRLQIYAATANRTIPCSRYPPTSNCNNLQIALDQMNMTCINERLKAENYRILQNFLLTELKNNCTKTINDYANKENMLTNENVQLQKDKKDLGTHIKLLQESCTTIDEKFKMELQNLKMIIDASLKPGEITHDAYTNVKCKPLTDSINSRIDFTLARLRQDVNNVVYENAQLRVTKERSIEDLGKCNQDKSVVTAERNNLATEKVSVEKQLGEKKDDLNKLYARYMKKEEDLEACRRQQQMRPPMFPPIRT